MNLVSRGTVVASLLILSTAYLAVRKPSNGPTEATPIAVERSADAVDVSGAVTAGDRLQVSVYEIVKRDQDRWQNDQTRARQSPAIILRNELSRDLVVGETGSFTMPVIGQVVARQATTRMLEQEMASRYATALGRPTTVVVHVVDRQPVYVLGDVKTSGAYKFVPGMTILHTVALAGGILRSPTDPYQSMELLRERGKFARASDRLEQLLAQRAVLRAELVQKPATVDPQMLQFVDNETAKKLIERERSARTNIVVASDTEETGLRKKTDEIRVELAAVRRRLPTAESSVALQTKQLEKFAALVRAGHLQETRLTAAQLELNRSREVVEQLNLQVLQTERALKESEHALEQAVARRKAGLEEALAKLDQDIAASGSDRQTSLRVTSSQAMGNVTPSIAAVEFELVRRADAGVARKAANGLEVMMPGDLVVVRIATPRSIANRIQ